jgi:hypothetical protein
MTISFELYAQVRTCLIRAGDSQLTLIAFNDIAEYNRGICDCLVHKIDVVGFGDHFDSPGMQNMLSLGLVRLRRLVDVDSCIARGQILYSPRPPST